MRTTEHYGKSTTVSLPATVLSTTVTAWPLIGANAYRSALGTSRRTTTEKARKPASEPWPPAAYALPSTLEAIEAGRAGQQEPPPNSIDDSPESDF